MIMKKKISKFPKKNVSCAICGRKNPPVQIKGLNVYCAKCFTDAQTELFKVIEVVVEDKK